MATVNFKLQQGKSEITKVYIRFREGGIDIEVPTNQVVHRDHWNPKKQEVRKSTETDKYRFDVNVLLDELRSNVTTAFNKIGDTTPCKEWLKDIIAETEGKEKPSTPDEEIYLAALGRVYAKESNGRTNSKTGNVIKPATIRDLHVTANKLEAYDRHSGKQVKLVDADLIFHRRFIQYLREVEYLSNNSIGGHIKNIKSFLREAALRKYKVSNAYLDKKFTKPFSVTKDPYLNIEELELIAEHPMDFDSDEDIARDWLLISCWTGLRVSDLLHLNAKDIVYRQNGKKSLDVRAKKTGIQVAIPIHHVVQDILDKRGGQFPPKTYSQKYNDDIKLACKIVGLDKPFDGGKLVYIGEDAEGRSMWRKVEGIYPKYEVVTSHIGRRSFATNHYKILDASLIMKITGHQSEKEFLKYIKITETEFSDLLADRWEEIHKNKILKVA